MKTKDAGGHVEVLPGKSKEVEKLLAAIIDSSPKDEPEKIAEAILAEVASATSADEMLASSLDVLSMEDLVGELFDVLSVQFFPSRYVNGSGPNYFAAARCQRNGQAFILTTSALKPLAKLAKAASEAWLPLQGVTAISSTTASGNTVYDLVKPKK
jgi:hypothetical protein